MGRVESKLVELGEVQGIVCGNFGEVSQALHNLVAALATSRVGTIKRKKRNHEKRTGRTVGGSVINQAEIGCGRGEGTGF